MLLCDFAFYLIPLFYGYAIYGFLILPLNSPTSGMFHLPLAYSLICHLMYGSSPLRPYFVKIYFVQVKIKSRNETATSIVFNPNQMNWLSVSMFLMVWLCCHLSLPTNTLLLHVLYGYFQYPIPCLLEPLLFIYSFSIFVWTIFYVFASIL